METEVTVDVQRTFFPLTGLAVDGAHIYWANGDGTIGRANVDGGAPNVSFIASGRAGALAVDALAPDTTAPVLSVSAKATQRAGKPVTVVVSCRDEACAVMATGTVTVPGAKSFRLGTAARAIGKGGQAALRLTIPGDAQKAITRARAGVAAYVVGALLLLALPVTAAGSRGVRRTTAEIEAADRAAGPGQRPVLPFRTNPRRMSLPSARAAGATPRSARAGGSRAVMATALTSGLNFNGVTGPTETGAFPPDTMGAVGPSQFTVAVNGRFRSFAKATGVADGAIDVGPDAFFASVMTPVGGSIIGNFTSDPHIRYDRLSQRWFIVMIDVPFTSTTPFTTASNRVLVARSDGPVITSSTAWTLFSFQADATNFADYPTLGVDANALYIGANMFTNAGSYAGTKMYVVRKSSLATGPLVVTPFAGASSVGAGPFTPQGVDNFDPAATTGYFIGVDNALFSLLDVRRVTDPAGTPTLSVDQALTVPATVLPISVPHLGNTGGNLDALDDRLFAAQLRGGHIWTAHNIQVGATGAASNTGGRDGSRWYEIDVAGAPSLVQSGTMFDPAAANPNSYWIPSVAVSGQNVMAIGGSVAGNNHSADAWFSGRLPSDPTGQLDAPTQYTASSTAYNPTGDSGSPRRWGDYSFTSVDPDDDMTMWTIQEYSNGTNTYGVRVARLSARPPATPSSTTPASVAAGQASTSIAVTGTPAAGSGFFDPGSGFAKRLSAAVGCGITVNSAAYVNPTEVQLDLDTTAATGGPCDVTITNPDDQAATGTGILALGAPTGPDLTVAKSHAGNFVSGDTGRTYSITASNAGGAPTAGTVSVSDTLPAGLTATAIAGTGWTCTLATLTCTRSDALGTGASHPVITLTVSVASSAPASVTNTATVSGGGETSTGNDTATDPTTINPPASGGGGGGGGDRPPPTGPNPPVIVPDPPAPPGISPLVPPPLGLPLPPAFSLHARRIAFRTLGDHGVKVSFTCSGPCTARGSVKLGSTRLGRGLRTPKHAGRATLVLRLTKTGIVSLRRSLKARSPRRLRVAVTVVGNGTTTRSATLTVRR
jgi:uncharacterized repeat protein (TIGR01451 family)